MGEWTRWWRGAQEFGVLLAGLRCAGADSDSDGQSDGDANSDADLDTLANADRDTIADTDIGSRS